MDKDLFCEIYCPDCPYVEHDDGYYGDEPIDPPSDYCPCDFDPEDPGCWVHDEYMEEAAKAEAEAEAEEEAEDDD